MTIEAVGVFVGKWIWAFTWGLIGTHWAWQRKQDKSKLDNCYTKQETSELIDLKIIPVRHECITRTDTLHAKFDTLVELVKANNEQSVEERKLNSAQIKDSSEILHEIKTKVALIENDVKHLSEKQQ